MLRRALILLALAAASWGANLRLYLKDGTYHVVREYEVLEDRVRYYSVERGDWEEIPLDLVDLQKTKAEVRERREAVEKEAAVLSAEEKVEREQREEAARVPQDVGVFWVTGTELQALKQAEPKVVTSKRRSVLKILTPVPVVAGKATVELDGERSSNVVTSGKPEFYIRLAVEERFGIIKLAPKGGARVVEKWSVVPVTNEIITEQQHIDILRKQVDDGVYKVWPKQPLEPGEYAVVEYTEGKGNTQIWDFSCRPAANP
jgi:hypothetical protein